MGDRASWGQGAAAPAGGLDLLTPHTAHVCAHPGAGALPGAAPAYVLSSFLCPGLRLAVVLIFMSHIFVICIPVAGARCV